MAKHMDIIDESCEKAWNALKKINQQELTDNNAKIMQELTHSLKSLSVLKKMEEEEEGGYSQRGRDVSRMYWDPMMHGQDYPDMYMGNSYGRNGNSYEGGSYEGGMSGARQRRDSMGRYARDGYDRSMARGRGYSGAAKDHLRKAMEEAQTETERRAIQRAMEEMEE